MDSFNEVIIRHWSSMLRRSQHEDTTINGRDLDIAAVVAIARFGAGAVLAEEQLPVVESAVDFIQTGLDNGLVIYGVNTGFGGSANTRTNHVSNLQNELIRMLNYGIRPEHRPSAPARSSLVNGNTAAFPKAIPLTNPESSLCLPESWVRAGMLVRLNSLVKGASGIRVSTLKNLCQLLENDIVPQIPLRGSISASGDLSPLSYIASAMMGKPSAKVWVGDRRLGDRHLTPASKALADTGIVPVSLSPKEGLAIVNGTGISAGVASLAAHEMLMQLGLAQILSAMSVEALRGTSESFDPFFAKVRPHPGQRESAQNILAFLQTSMLLHDDEADSGTGTLRQDRYSIRTASQWIGPCIEDVLLAVQQVTIELNSVTDNPLVDVESRRILHGGNFQAKSVTNAMEKLRQASQSIGRMIFAQCTELINPATNFGLPPNLVADDPSESFLWKGTDIMVAALQSELGFLANPVGSHVQTAEMGNQALNSLALISARFTLDALDVLTQMAAAHLVALCQALDLRVIHLELLRILRVDLEVTLSDCFLRFLAADAFDVFAAQIWAHVQASLDKNVTLDAAQRFEAVFKSCQPLILEMLPKTGIDAAAMLAEMRAWTSTMTKGSTELYWIVVDRYLTEGDASPFLGSASKRLYTFVRRRLNIPFLCSRKSSDVDADAGADAAAAAADGTLPSDPPTVGEFNSRVYHSMRNGELYTEVCTAIADVAIAQYVDGKGGHAW